LGSAAATPGASPASPPESPAARAAALLSDERILGPYPTGRAKGQLLGDEGDQVGRRAPAQAGRFSVDVGMRLKSREKKHLARGSPRIGRYASAQGSPVTGRSQGRDREVTRTIFRGRSRVKKSAMISVGWQ